VRCLDRLTDDEQQHILHIEDLTRIYQAGDSRPSAEGQIRSTARRTCYRPAGAAQPALFRTNMILMEDMTEIASDLLERAASYCGKNI
jgi:hypothetical protein